MSASNRRQPARSARTSTTRPSNYYHHYGGRATQPQEPESQQPVPHGFFPAIQHFTDGIAALPKEVIRHMTLLKETEGKAYQPDQAISGLIDKINQLPPPPRYSHQAPPQAFFGFSYSNSLNGSAPASVVDGSIPATQVTEQTDNTQTVDEHQDVRRRAYFDLRETLKQMLVVLDEKNMVLSSTNDTLTRQLARLDNVLPYVEKEVSEEARLGSTTHWALPHMKEARRVTGTTNDRSRRDVQAANNLAAAAAAVHENDIAAARSEARREAMLSKRRQNVDSDFDERQPSKRAHAGSKNKKTAVSSAADGKSGPSGQSNKRRRVEKDAAPTMERSISAATIGKGTAAREGPSNARSAAPAESRRRPKQATTNGPSKKRNPVSSPQLASSPTRGTFSTTATRAYSPGAANARPGTSRGRQGSGLSVKSSLQDQSIRDGRQSLSAIGKGNISNAQLNTTDIRAIANATGRSAGEARSAVRDAHITQDGDRLIEQDGIHGGLVLNGDSHSTTTKREVVDSTDPEGLASDSTRTRAGKPPTPTVGPATTTSSIGATDAIESQSMGRSRSTRGAAGANNGHANPTSKRPSASSPALTSTYPRRSQYKGGAGGTDIDMIPEGDGTSESGAEQAEGEADVDVDADVDGSVEGEGSVEGSSPGSDEPRYCICQQPSYGSMVACDNPSCPHEWFHLECVGLSEEPPENTKWFCEDCKRSLKRSRGGGNGR